MGTDVQMRRDPGRFGGPDGLAACERAWTEGAVDASEAMRTHGSRARRLRLAADLVLAAVFASGVEWPEAVPVLRRLTRSCTPVEQQADIRLAAEMSYARNQTEWAGQPARVRAAIAGNGPVARWYRRQVGLWAELQAVTPDPHAAFDAHLRVVLDEAYGLAPADQGLVAWQVSLALVSPVPRASFFADAMTAPDRHLHEQSKYFVFRGEDQKADEDLDARQGRQDLGPLLKVVPLPPPERPAGRDLVDVLIARRSGHGRYGGRFTLAELSTLLHHTAGNTGTRRVGGAEVPARTYPSGGGRYPVRLVLYCHAVDGLARGLYLYDPDRHSLGLLSPGDETARLTRTSAWLDPRMPEPKSGGGRIEAGECPLWVFPVADLTYQRLAYGLRAYRLVLIECGHLAQNLSLVATWLGRSSIGIGGYLDDALDQVLGLDGVNTTSMYLYLVGDLVEPATG